MVIFHGNVNQMVYIIYWLHFPKLDEKKVRLKFPKMALALMTFASFFHDHSGAEAEFRPRIGQIHPMSPWEIPETTTGYGEWEIFRIRLIGATDSIFFRPIKYRPEFPGICSNTWYDFRIRKFPLIWRQSNNCNDKTWAFDHERLLPRCPEMMSDGKIRQIVPCSCRIFQKRSILSRASWALFTKNTQIWCLGLSMCQTAPI